MSQKMLHPLMTSVQAQTLLHNMENFRIKSSHPEEQIIGSKNDHLNTRSSFINEYSMFGMMSMLEPTSTTEALKDDGCIMTMQRQVIGASKTHRYSLRNMVVTGKGELLKHKREVFSNLLQFVLRVWFVLL
ncbi:hypothetical protein MTR_1g027870 [Medicago truncatula]|uniref:Uncharacterized protein n=1 Tax=Medicago truncatula TaxID=3880 RepID=A0A072VQI4_MEDTR|nr:hypothetical protein MTR_1g027870 [Medicago truncatula]